MNDRESARLACEMHRRIVGRIRAVWANKVEVYRLLAEFKRRRLYRLLDLPIARRHAANICAGRRFSTWEDYLSGLGGGGISFGYFAELERLERRYGPEMIRLCAAGLHVVTRRQLLRCWERTAEEVREVLASGLPDDERIRRIDNAAAMWQSEHDHAYPTTPTPHRRVSDYRRHVGRWEERLSQAVDEAARVPCNFRRGRVFRLLPVAWIEVFEEHLAIGERLGDAALSRAMTATEAKLLREMRGMWARGHPVRWAAA